MFEVGAHAHFSNGQAENRIKLCRWTIDRTRFDHPPDSKNGWRLILAIIQGCVNGELDASQTTASKRVLGRDVHLMVKLVVQTTQQVFEGIHPAFELVQLRMAARADGLHLAGGIAWERHASNGRCHSRRLS